MRKTLLFSIAAASLLAGPALAQKPPELAATAAAMLKCRQETNAEARLRCFDAAAARFGAEVDSGALVVVDREGIRRTRRSLFGLDINLPFFGKDDRGDEGAPQEIVATVKTARVVGYDNWLLELDTGAFWQTTEPSPSTLPPRAGDTVKIRKGLAGGYMLHFAQRQIRVKRVH